MIVYLATITRAQLKDIMIFVDKKQGESQYGSIASNAGQGKRGNENIPGIWHNSLFFSSLVYSMTFHFKIFNFIR